jgi:hypothetical protein
VRSARFGLVLGALALATCSLLVLGSELQGKATKPPTQQRSDDGLTATPNPLTLDALRRAHPGSASEAVLRLWFWAQWAGSASVLSAYDPRVVKGVGAGRIVTAYRSVQASLAQTEPQVVEESVGPAGTVVTVRALTEGHPPSDYSFTLWKVKGSWYITYDTLLDNALAAPNQAMPTPVGKEQNPPPAAVQAGLEASRRYRQLSLRLRRPPRPAAVLRAPI